MSAFPDLPIPFERHLLSSSPAAVRRLKAQNSDTHHSTELVRSVSCSKMGTAMLTYEDLVELAKLCARNSRISTSREVAKELWQMAKEYQAEAGKLGDVPEIDEAPPLSSEDR